MQFQPVIGIVGSAGAYGRWIGRVVHERLGWRVLGSDPADPQSLPAEHLIAQSEILLFSAPVAQTEALIRRYARLAGARARAQLWLDLTSIKVAPIEAMLSSEAEVVGLHPLCAPPKAPSLRGRLLVVCEARLQHRRAWLEALLQALEAQCIRMSADAHDRRMALVQNMLHAGHLASTAAAATICGEHSDAADVLACRTVGYEADFATSARMLSGNAQLYIDILLGNPHAGAAVDALISELQLIRSRIATGNATALREDSFARARTWLGPNLLTRGNYTFERLGYLLADLNDARALSIYLVEDAPGSLRRLLEVFERLGINIDSVHSSRTPGGDVHFRFGFGSTTTTAAIEAAALAIEAGGLGRVLADPSA